MEPEAAVNGNMEQLQKLADTDAWPQPSEELLQQAAGLKQALLQYNTDTSPEALAQALKAVADFMAPGEAHITAMHMAMQQQPDAYAALARQCLTHSNQDVMVEAVRIISSLAEYGGGCIALLAQDDTFNELIRCCWQTSRPIVPQRAAFAATLLAQGLYGAYGPEEQASALCSLLQRCLDSEVGSAYALEQALTAVATMLSNGGPTAVAWCQHPGALQLTVRCLQQRDSSEVVARAVVVFVYLSMHNESCSVLQQQASAVWVDALQALLQCLSSPSAAVVANGVIAIGNMAATEDGSTTVSQQAGMAAALVRALGHADPGVVEVAAWAINRVSGNSKGNFSSVAEQPSAVQALIGCLNNGSQRAAAEAARAVSNLAGQEASRIELLRRGSMLKALAMCLRKDSPAAVTSAADAIGRIASFEDGCVKVIQAQAAILPALTTCLEHQNEEVVHAAAWAISNVLTDEAGRDAILQRTAILPAFVRALAHKAPAVRQDVLRGMLNVVESAQGSVAFMQQEGALSAVVACLSGDEALKRSAIDTLEALRRNLPGAAPAIWDALAEVVKSNAEKAQMEELQRNVTEVVVGLAGRMRGTG